jgi:hypothetical protein
MAPHSQNDLATMIEVSQALSGEMVLKLIDQLMRAALEHAGASRSCDRVVQSFTSERSLEDWRDCVLHVSDDQGDELFVVPFTFVLGKPN